MKRVVNFFKYTFVTLALYCASGASIAQTMPSKLTQLYQDLRQSAPENAPKIEAEIRFLWTSSGSHTVDLLVKRGQDALDRGETALAAEHFSAAIELGPRYAGAFILRARAYVLAGVLGPAVHDLQTALRLDENQFDAIALLGQVFERLGDLDLAQRSYEQALAIHPHFAQVKEAQAALRAVVGDQAL